jgi:hypothetical protein
MFNLGKKRDSGMDIATSSSEKSSGEDEVVYYPSLYLNEISGLETPDVGTEGTAKIKFRVVSQNESERKNESGIKESKSVDIEVMGIEFDSEDKESEDEDEIEKGLSESEKETKDEEED